MLFCSSLFNQFIDESIEVVDELNGFPNTWDNRQSEDEIRMDGGRNTKESVRIMEISYSSISAQHILKSMYIHFRCARDKNQTNLVSGNFKLLSIMWNPNCTWRLDDTIHVVVASVLFLGYLTATWNGSTDYCRCSKVGAGWVKCFRHTVRGAWAL